MKNDIKLTKQQVDVLVNEITRRVNEVINEKNKQELDKYVNKLLKTDYGKELKKLYDVEKLISRLKESNTISPTYYSSLSAQNTIVALTREIYKKELKHTFPPKTWDIKHKVVLSTISKESFDAEAFINNIVKDLVK